MLFSTDVNCVSPIQVAAVMKSRTTSAHLINLRSTFLQQMSDTIYKLKDCRTKAVCCDDFRGIAISPMLSKVFEHSILQQLQSYIVTSDNQFGFKRASDVHMQFILCEILLIIGALEVVVLICVPLT